MSTHEIREWREGDAAAWLACQRACFGEERAKSEAEWRHLFDAGGLTSLADSVGSTPCEPQTRGIVAMDGERVLASCVGTPTRTWFAGEERICVHWVDLMVHPEHRRGLGGQHLHRDVAEAFFARYGDAGGDLMHFGWPIAPARRFGERFLSYQFVREELCLVRDVPAVVSDSPLTAVQLTAADVAAAPEQVQWLWDRCAGGWGLSAIRDAAWLCWRFLDHPEVRYRVIGVRDAGILRGLAVVRETPWHWEGALAVCDWLVPDGEPEVARELESAILHTAHDLGLLRAVILLPPFAPASSSLQSVGWTAQPAPYQWMIRSFDRRLDARWVHRHGWFTLADTDLA